MHEPVLKGLLTRLGIHSPHIHFEGTHQGAASKQVLRMDNLPEQNHKQPVRLGREKPLGMGVDRGRGRGRAWAHWVIDSVTSIFLSKVGRYLAGHRAGLLRLGISLSCLIPRPPSLHCCYIGFTFYRGIQLKEQEGANIHALLPLGQPASGQRDAVL